MDEDLLREMDRSIKKAALGGRSEVIRFAMRAWLRQQSLQQKIKREIEGYRKKPVMEDEFVPLMNSQEFPS